MNILVKYLAVQLLHSDQVQRFEGMSGGGNEVQADMNPAVVVVEEGMLDLQFLLKVVLKLRVDVIHNRLVAVWREHMRN